ncbi:MAG: T9SS type A sorting domain-containing protein [candidate division Zixibacteria bacterium]|nr:T9SS type A sorting domain-containing protein [candidate division Zixibacteria bacterium]
MKKLLALTAIVCLSCFSIANASNVVWTDHNPQASNYGNSRAFVEESDAGNQLNLPENFEDYIPMPIPEYKPASGSSNENLVVSYDPATGEETIREIIIDNPLNSDHTESGAGWLQKMDNLESNYQGMIDGFGGLSQITNPEDHPWCVNCKVYFTKGGSNYVASGTLIDAMHVITAGHVVHEGNGGSWSTDITVVPAYENGSAPYGTAGHTQLHSWTGWTQNGDFDHDMGVIDLDRPVGSMTGWHGYGYNNNDNFFLTETFNQAGYPAESPYNGQYMYYWYGTYDYAYTYQVGHYDRPYGGMSGSGSYDIDSGSRYVYAVLSNGNTSLVNDVRITSTKFGHIGNFISNDTPSSVDLIALDVNTSPVYINAGQQLSDMNYLVHNYSSASYSGRVDVDVYLSSNDNISPSDRLIDSHYFNWSFTAKSSVRINVTNPPVIPSDVTTGDYYIGIILDFSDYNTDNNDTDGQDASPIHVTGGGGGTIGINMIPSNPPVTVPRGGYFRFTGILENYTSQYRTTDVWVMVQLPGGAQYGPVQQFNNISLSPYQNITVPNVRQDVPSYAPLGTYDYVSYCGNYPGSKVDSASFPFTVVGVDGGNARDWNLAGWFDGQSNIPASTSLLSNYPNPFNAATSIPFELSEDSNVSVKIYNLSGQLVETLVDGYMEAGSHSVNWDASTVSSGVYFYTLQTDNYSATKKMNLLK